MCVYFTNNPRITAYTIWIITSDFALQYSKHPGGEKMVDANFIRNRITQLRLQKGVSEYQMGYDLGHSRSYVYNISSGKSLPPLPEFLEICDYFGITPSQFFDTSIENPALLQTAIEELKKLNDDDLMLIIGNIRRLTKDW